MQSFPYFLIDFNQINIPKKLRSGNYNPAEKVFIELLFPGASKKGISSLKHLPLKALLDNYEI
jgi:hypothetical protein